VLTLLAMEGFALHGIRARTLQWQTQSTRCEASIRSLGIAAAKPDRLDAYTEALSEGLASAPQAVENPVKRAALAMEMELALAGEGMGAKAARECSAQIVADSCVAGLVKALVQQRGLTLLSVSAPARVGTVDCWMIDLSCAPSYLGKALESFCGVASGPALEGLDMHIVDDGRMMARLRVRTAFNKEGRK